MLGKDSLNLDQANTVIMAARAHWFDGEGKEA
jgi:N utilization substance protein A